MKGIRNSPANKVRQNASTNPRVSSGNEVSNGALANNPLVLQRTAAATTSQRACWETECVASRSFTGASLLREEEICLIDIRDPDDQHAHVALSGMDDTGWDVDQ